MYYVGIDIGSTASKVVVRGEKELHFVLPTGWSSKETCQIIKEKLETENIDVLSDETKVVATGYGRVAVEFADFVITEIGGTFCDIESQPFLEAIRQVAGDVGRNNVMYIHVTLVPYLKTSGELKSKPTQHSVKELLSIGIQPDMLICRSEVPLEESQKDKIALFCNVSKDCVFENLNCDTIYDVCTAGANACSRCTQSFSERLW